MRNAVVMRPSRKQVLEDRVKYLDHVYAHGYVYAVWDRVFGQRFS
jgi:hypothetical protein